MGNKASLLQNDNCTRSFVSQFPVVFEPELTKCSQLNVLNMTNDNNVVLCLKEGSLVGLSSDSASATDIYKFEYKEMTKFQGKDLKTAIMKAFVTQYKHKNKWYEMKNRVFTMSMFFEYLIYSTRIRVLTDNMICPFFIQYLGGSLNVDADKMVDFLSKGSGLPLSTIKNNLLRNVQTIIPDNPDQYDSMPERLSITDSTAGEDNGRKLYLPIDSNQYTVVSSMKDLKLDNFRFGFILTEAVKVLSTDNILQDERKPGECFYLKQFVKLMPLDELELLNLLMQIAFACYSLQCIGVCHNDLHLENIFVQKLQDPVTNKLCFVLNGKLQYALNTSYNKCLIYDFDFGRIEGFALKTRRDSSHNNTQAYEDFLDLVRFIMDIIIMNKNNYQSETADIDYVLANSSIFSTNYRGNVHGKLLDFLTSLITINKTVSKWDILPVALSQVSEYIKMNFAFEFDVVSSVHTYVCAPQLFNDGMLDKEQYFQMIESIAKK